MTTPTPATINLASIFQSLQHEMLKRFESLPQIPHPTAKGDYTEHAWTDLLNNYLPKRYQTAKAFVLDSQGRISQQIDLVIFDRQYSPFLFNQNGALYVPAESVYAVLEIKQFLCKQILDYAAEKTASVRALRRTSAPIIHAGHKLRPRHPFPILAGLITLSSQWSPPFHTRFHRAIRAHSPASRLDLGLVLNRGAFHITYPTRRLPKVDSSPSETALITFFLTLLSRLQSLGTVPALDIAAYAKSLTFSNSEQASSPSPNPKLVPSHNRGSKT